MNLHINATGLAIFPSGKRHSVSESFNCLQTPTDATNKIMASSDKIQAYKDWVKSIWKKDEQEDILDYDTFDPDTQYYKVIGTRYFNPADEHIALLDEFLKNVKEKGLDLDIYSM
jgi:hypothetical protein